jgi:hypothetical protein
MTVRFPWTAPAATATALVLGLASVVAHADTFGPSPYLSAADSPFTSVTGLVIETFEDGALNTPGVAASGAWFVSGPSVFSDSVDADDGAIDGTGAGGFAFYSAGTETTLTLTFDAAALGGQLPTHAGLVFTDVGNVFAGSSGFGTVTFTAYDAADAQIGTSIVAVVGDGSAFSSTAEDRFFGITHDAGVKRITMSMDNSVDWEVDHLQYAVAVPEPSTYALLALGAVAIGARVATRRKG